MSAPHRPAIHSIHNKKFWTEFFCLYESQTALWDVNSTLYKNRQVKCNAYEIMVEKLREIEPNSDREDVLRKINIFRTNFRRELSRISASRSEGRPYKSTLWYFDLLSFLQTADTRERRKRKLVDDDGEKSIMRKRRNTSTVLKPLEKILIATNKKDSLIEFQPQTEIDFDYDKYEEPDFDYVVDLTDRLVEPKDENTDIEHALQMQSEDYNRESGEDEDHTQSGYVHEYQNFSAQSSNITTSAHSPSSKIELTPPEITLRNTMGSDPGEDEVGGGGLIISPPSTLQHHDHVYEEYESDTATDAVDNVDESLTTETQWCSVKTQMPQHLVLQQTSNIDTSPVAHDPERNYNENPPSMTTKFVRDVKTMTSARTSPCCQSNRLSESSEIIAKSWAIQYDELTQDQKVLARKAINDILFEACLGHLVIDSNGRVTTSISGSNTDRISVQDSIQAEVESGEIYGQSMSSTSTTNVPKVSNKISSNDQWLKQ